MIPDAVTPDMLGKGIIVQEMVPGRPLKDEIESRGNVKIPFKFHFGAIMGQMDMLTRLAQINVAMDTNVDTDLLLNPHPDTKVLDVVRVDCTPASGGGSDRAVPILGFAWTQEQASVYDLIVVMQQLYANRYFDFLGETVPTLEKMFNNGEIMNIKTLFDFLKQRLSTVDWSNDFIFRGDNIRLRKWVGAEFD